MGLEAGNLRQANEIPEINISGKWSYLSMLKQ